MDRIYQRITIYTAAYGRHAFAGCLKPVRHIDGVRFVAFTDNALVRAEGWEVRVMRGRFVDGRMSAKWFKMASTFLFLEDDLTIWIDASITPRDGDARALVDVVKASEHRITMFAHPERNDIYSEAAVSAGMAKYAGEPLVEQVAHYQRAGLPAKHGLWACGVIGRLTDPGPNYEPVDPVAQIAAFDAAWLNECIRWSCQDQLSLPYVLHALKIQIGTIPGSIYDNPLITREWLGPNF